MKYLITGSNGLLGQKIVRQLENKQENYLATSLGKNRNKDCPNAKYQTLDITSRKDVFACIEKYQPDAIINTAAMTNVDACEEDAENCHLINVQAVKNLVDCCKLLGIHFTQVSTDFVFDGENGPYKETDTVNPLSVYAKSKVESETFLQDNDFENWAILRTIIVFGNGNNLSRSNIVLWAKSALEKGEKLTIVDDQFRAPTWADDLAWACIQSAKRQVKGIFHISGPETNSMYQWVIRIADHFGYDRSLVKPIKTSDLNQKAGRPPFTGFHLNKAEKELGYKPMKFEESLSKLFP
jgi:dTDP-4-dehydrorhamnose reductase